MRIKTIYMYVCIYIKLLVFIVFPPRYPARRMAYLNFYVYIDIYLYT